MKILHTADWHLGKRLDRFSRLEEQILVMEEITRIADQQKVDLVLVAGDLFDTFSPKVEASDLFYKTLKKLAANGKRPVIAISGNHDSPYFIDSPDPLARECGIILIGHPNAEVLPFQLDHFKISKSAKGFIELKLKNIDFPVRILHTAYANEVRLKEYFGENKEEQLNKTLAKNWQDIANEYCDETGVNLLMAHLYMNKKGTAELEEPDGEKPLKIGNADLVYSDSIPPQIQYTALGHLHGFQNIGTSERPVIYASSPLCYSFSEAGQSKFVSIIDAQPNTNVSYHKIPLESGKQLVRKSFDSVENTVKWLLENPNTLVEISVESDTFLTSEERKIIYQSHNGIVYLIPKLKNEQFDERNVKEVNLEQDIEVLFKEYFASKNAGQIPNNEVMMMFNEIKNL